MAKVRFQMFLDTHQKEALEKLQKNSKTPVAELIRKAIDQFLHEWGGKNISSRDGVTEKLLSIAGTCKDGQKNLADAHDRYL